MSYNIAIDGPAGAGKSTIAKAVDGIDLCGYRFHVSSNGITYAEKRSRYRK